MWRKGDLLGSGSYGDVFAACKEDSEGSSLMAVKSAVLQSDVDSLNLEGQFLAQLCGQPNVVRCFGEDVSLENGQSVFNLLLEYAPGGSLEDLIKNTYNKHSQIMPELDVACYTRMLLRGLAAIHAKGIVHCDLKPANILVFPACGGINELKIADFGVSRRVSEEEKIQVWDGTETYYKGTLLYSSPESVAYGLHGTSADIWALGCIVCEMITGKPIWEEGWGLVDQILFGTINTSLFSQDMRGFLEKCLHRNPVCRWSAENLLHHPFIVKNSVQSEITSHCQENPLGVNGWVSKRNLFSTPAQEPPQLQQWQYHQFVLGQQIHHPFQIPCGI